MKQKLHNLFRRFQTKFGWSGRSFRLDLRPMFHFYWDPCGFSIPDFYIEWLQSLSIMFMAGHHEWILIFEAFKNRKVFRI